MKFTRYLYASAKIVLVARDRVKLNYIPRELSGFAYSIW